ncbi:ABC transporter permease [Pontibacter actiniarum]|uniref:ABC transporter permease n=1 Tax=Pontibacter actiniarum TaxID=323450 RepID=A0A1X9YU37_9BACT|nr:ABC transporter permease [Pontibacter actiniarum]ARS36341.1 ABC transporter permease [Pontibacter actiniarum]
MSKVWLIIQREYLSRVRKKSFIIMTLLTPLLLATFMVLPGLLISMSDETETVMVLDKSGLFEGKLQNKKDLNFIPLAGTLDQAKTVYQETDNTALLYIPEMSLSNPEGFVVYGKKNISIQTQVRLENMLEKEIESQRYLASGLDRETLDKIKANVDLTAINLSDQGEKDNNAIITSIAGVVGAVVIYFFIFLYGVQIMRGVIEEKTSRIVEVMISSVKPFQLMMGKIIGIAAVGLTQFLLWIVLSFVAVTGVSAAFGIDAAPSPAAQYAAGQVAAQGEDVEEGGATVDNPAEKDEFASTIRDVKQSLANLNVGLIFVCFLFYFLGGYLLYGSLFGAIGAAVDNETDTQQFMMPITIPLVISFIMSYSVVLKNPDGPVAFWMSIIPLTSPIVMMVRVPFGVPAWELLLSMGLLVAGFIFTTWIASRIYRVGILMYGKKVNYKELSKWLFYRV